MTQRQAPHSNKRVVIARDADGHFFVVGSVFSETAVHTLAEQVRADGWTVECASAPIFSRADFTDWPRPTASSAP
jgi:hypothetical protein